MAEMREEKADTKCRIYSCKFRLDLKLKFKSVLGSQRAQPIEDTAQHHIEGRPLIGLPSSIRHEYNLLHVRGGNGVYEGDFFWFWTPSFGVKH